ncbi:MAG TPA: hypothetical protein VJ826_05115 [Candidatus Polarisedimenticolaceae bacterium]|nr:hypothetical protein [Candidatus Polarisedimenticolaceae bacterium]
MSDFLARYRATETALQAYVEQLPLWVDVWRGWMFVLFGAAVIFLVPRREARWLAVTMVVSLVAYNLVAMYTGVGRFPSIALVVFWLPLAIYLLRRRPALATTTRFDRLYRAWITVCVATLAVSVAFDTYNVGYALVNRVP